MIQEVEDTDKLLRGQGKVLCCQRRIPVSVLSKKIQYFPRFFLLVFFISKRPKKGIALDDFICHMEAALPRVFVCPGSHLTSSAAHPLRGCPRQAHPGLGRHGDPLRSGEGVPLGGHPRGGRSHHRAAAQRVAVPLGQHGAA